MTDRTAHRKLISLLCLSFLTAGGLAGLAGCSGVVPAPQEQASGAFQSYDQVVESFDRIVPGMTQAQDLPGLGLDTRTATVLAPEDIVARFRPAHLRHKMVIPAVRDCIKMKLYCNAYVFHADSRSGQAANAPALFGHPWSADITLLVMNGRVTHKVLADDQDETPKDQPTLLAAQTR